MTSNIVSEGITSSSTEAALVRSMLGQTDLYMYLSISVSFWPCFCLSRFGIV